MKQFEAEPESAKAIFGPQIEKARAFAQKLANDSDDLGLLGPRELDKLWSRHILNSAVVAETVKAGDLVADVGSGAGLPGIPMAIALPEARFVLIEPMERRSSWMLEVIQELGLTNIEVRRARAEEVLDLKFDIVTARAVAALDKLLRLTVHLLKTGGSLIALKGSKAAEEIEAAKRLQKKLGIASFEIQICGEKFLAEPTSVVKTTLDSSKEN
ncbi:MAG: 16S rRNA (guanine(527)-N(7))-methyltransferase RsmG [Rhodoluna sp.]|nr:16S rRNA (guanine(527)-N(7))-methyltransferase RsmG [Rhodoluna sp.]